MPKFGDLSYREFIPTYAGSPLGELGQLRKTAEGVGDSLQKQYHANRDTYDTISIALANMRVGENDPAAMKAKQDAEAKLRGVLSSVQETGAWEHANPMVRKATRDLYTDKNLQAATENFKRMEEYYNQRNKMISEFGEANVLELGDKPEQFTQSGEDGQLKYFRGTPERRLQYHEMKQDIWKNVAADLTEDQIKRLQLDGEDMAKLVQGSTYGISENKINDLLDEAMTMYKGTDEYEQEKRLLESQGKDPDSEIMNTLKATGMMHKFSRRDTKLDNDNVALQRQKLEAEYKISNLSKVSLEVMKPGGAYKNTDALVKDKNVTADLVDQYKVLWDTKLREIYGDKIPIGVSYEEFSKKVDVTKSMDKAYIQGRNALIEDERFKKLSHESKATALRKYDVENSAYDNFGTPVFIKNLDMFYDENGKNHGLELLDLYYRTKDTEDRFNSINEYEQEMQQKALRLVHGNTNQKEYFNTPAYKKLEEDAANLAYNAAAVALQTNDPQKILSSDIYSSRYQQYLQDKDPVASKYNELVQEDSKPRSVTSVAVKAEGYNQGEKNMNESLVNYGKLFMGLHGVDAVRFRTQMGTVTDSEFIEEVDPDKLQLVGIEMDSESSNGYVVSYQAFPKGGDDAKFSDESQDKVLEVNAPPNIEEVLVALGVQSPMVTRGLKVVQDAQKTPNRKLNYGDGAKVEYLTTTDNPTGTYTLYLETREGEQSFPNMGTELEVYQMYMNYLKVTMNSKYGDEKPTLKELGF